MKKIDLNRRNSFGTLDWLESWNEPSAAKLIEEKINELVDAVNSIVSVQEKLIDSRFVVETKHEAPAENAQDKTPEQMGYIKLDSDSLAAFLKAHPKYNKNGILDLQSCSVRLQDELEPADPIANNALKKITAEQKDVK